MKSSTSVVIVTFLLMGVMFFSGTHVKSDIDDLGGFPQKTLSLRGLNMTDIPTWYPGDTWVYDAHFFSDSDNGTFDLYSSDLTFTVVDVTIQTVNDTEYDVYILNISGNVTGTFSSSFLSGDVDGVILGNISIRRSDLAVVTSNVTSFGVIEYLLLQFDYETSTIATYSPPLEYYDFPIKKGETWNISSNVSTQSSFYVEDFYDNSSESNDTIDGEMECLNVENISVPAGTFETFHLYTEDNGTTELWYSPEVKNNVKTIINRTSENETNRIHMNLSGYMLTSQPIQVIQQITPAVTPFWEYVTIHGNASYTSSGLPVANENVTIFFPYINEEWNIQTNATGFYSHTITAPVLIDDTHTTYDLGSDGIIVMVSNGSQIGYAVHTLTVIDMPKITDVFPRWNFIALPFNVSLNLNDLIIKWNHSYLNWTQTTTSDNPTGAPILSPYIFGWDRISQTYLLSSLLYPGYGYWLYAYEPCELKAPVFETGFEGYITALQEKWNVVGCPNDAVVLKADVLVRYGGTDYTWADAVSAGIISDYIFGWDGAVQSYVFSDQFTPGECYWLYAYNPCVLKQ